MKQHFNVYEVSISKTNIETQQLPQVVFTTALQKCIELEKIKRNGILLNS